MKQCMKCYRRLPRWLFKNTTPGWFSRDGKVYYCRPCQFKHNERWEKDPDAKGLFTSLKIKPQTFIERLARALTP